MAYINDYTYYENTGNPHTEQANWGSYQYVSLYDIVNNFMLMYAGNHSLVNNEERYRVLFHAKRAIQELNYDAFKEIKILELDVCERLRFVLPQDYVNWVRVSLYKDGVLRPLTENIQTNWSDAYLQDHTCRILFDHDGNILKPSQAFIDLQRVEGTKKSIYLNDQSPYNNREGYCVDGEWYFDYGVGNLCIVEYVSDGMENGDDSLVTVNKLFEEYVYAYIQYAILNSKFGVQEYVVNRARKRSSSLLRNAKIRISNIHPGRLLQNMRGMDKWIK